VAGPAAGATPEVRAALRKLVRALPETLRADAEAAAGAVHVDPSGWGTRPAPPPPPHLDALQRAIVRGEQVVLGYRSAERASERTVHPLGLVAKGPTWYLVAGTDAGQRTFRVDRVTAVAPTGEPVVRPDDFDLSTAWAAIAEQVGGLMAPARVEALVDPDAVGVLRMVFGRRLSLGGPGPDGRVVVEVAGPSPEVVASELSGFGRRVEVVAPPSARAHLVRLAAELVEVYGAGAG
jgi:predicted DNA-binding transcriptional regulator YafY